MREGVGMTLVMYYMVPILVLFVFFIAFVIRYAASYRIVNAYIDNMEMCDAGGTCNGSPSSDTRCSCYSYKNGYICAVEYDVEMELPVLGMFNVYTIKSETKTMEKRRC